jgi:Na+/glutamate symporter
MHQVFLATRPLLYLDGRADAGRSQALTLTIIGLVIGLLLGGIVTRIYDRRGYHRTPALAEPAAAASLRQIPSSGTYSTAAKAAR